jgi:hypothetical protein
MGRFPLDDSADTPWVGRAVAVLGLIDVTAISPEQVVEKILEALGGDPPAPNRQFGPTPSREAE